MKKLFLFATMLLVTTFSLSSISCSSDDSNPNPTITPTPPDDNSTGGSGNENQNPIIGTWLLSEQKLSGSSWTNVEFLGQTKTFRTDGIYQDNGGAEIEYEILDNGKKIRIHTAGTFVSRIDLDIITIDNNNLHCLSTTYLESGFDQAVEQKYKKTN